MGEEYEETDEGCERRQRPCGGGGDLDDDFMEGVLELMIPPTKRPGSVVVTRPASHGEVPGSNPGLVVLFSLTGWAGIGTGLRIAGTPQASDDDDDGSKHTDPEQDEEDPVRTGPTTRTKAMDRKNT